MNQSKEALALIRAIKGANAKEVARLIVLVPDLNETDSQGWTPLFHAAGRGNKQVMKLLIKAGANVNQGLAKGFTALFSAVTCGQLEAVRILLEAGAEPRPVQGIELRNSVPTHVHAKDREKIIELLIKKER